MNGRFARKVAKQKRLAAAELRRIAATISRQSDQITLIGYASWLESEAAFLDDRAAEADTTRSRARQTLH